MIKEIVELSFEIKNKYSNINNLIREHNIIVINDENIQDIRAYTLTIRNKNIIVIDAFLDEVEYDFVLCHEIFHIISHDDTTRCFSSILNTNKYELQANIFAVIFLSLSYTNLKTDIAKIINNTLATISV